MDASTEPLVDMDVYDAGARTFDLDVLKDQPCWLGVDLSSTIDLSVIVACWRLAEGYFVKPWFFCPQETIEAKDDGGFGEDAVSEREDRSGAAYRAWQEDGLISVALPRQAPQTRSQHMDSHRRLARPRSCHASRDRGVRAMVRRPVR